MKINGEILLKFVLWDSYGNPDYRNVWMTFVKGIGVFIQNLRSDKVIKLNLKLITGSMVNALFFDLNSKSSFEKLNDWVNLIQEHGESDSIMCLIGNKKENVK